MADCVWTKATEDLAHHIHHMYLVCKPGCIPEPGKLPRLKDLRQEVIDHYVDQMFWDRVRISWSYPVFNPITS